MAKYRVVSSGISPMNRKAPNAGEPWQRDEIVTDKELKDAGHSIERLKRLEAIQPVTAAEAQAAQKSGASEPTGQPDTPPDSDYDAQPGN